MVGVRVCGSVQSVGLDGSTKLLQLIVASDIMLMLSVFH